MGWQNRWQVTYGLRSELARKAAAATHADGDPLAHRLIQLTTWRLMRWMSWLRDRHYDKAPIKEAIIDIQVEHSRRSL